ncbi:unnamed protein product, partial [Oppiella nova]
IRLLTIASGCANVVQLVSFIIIIYNLVQNVEPISSRRAIGNELPLFFSITVYTFEGITSSMPLYRAVRNKHNFSKLFGVVNGAILIAISLYIAIGLLGYLKYGDEVESVITLSLPNEPVYDSVLLMYSLAVTVSYPVQMYVAIQQLWPRIESRLQAHKMDSNYINASNYILRTVLVIITFGLAAFIPRLDLIIALVGAVSSSFIAIIIPPVLHTIIYWERDISKQRKRVIYTRNLIVFIVGILGFATGTYFKIL